MNEAEGLALLPLIIIDALLSVTLFYIWLKVAGARNQLRISELETGNIFHNLARRLKEQIKYSLFSLLVFSFPFLFLWLTSLVLIPTAFGEVISSSLIWLLLLDFVALIGTRDKLYISESD